jgi:hypothetical protein
MQYRLPYILAVLPENMADSVRETRLTMKRYHADVVNDDSPGYVAE